LRNYVLKQAPSRAIHYSHGEVHGKVCPQSVVPEYFSNLGVKILMKMRLKLLECP
jgi:hypothetical protein